MPLCLELCPCKLIGQTRLTGNSRGCHLSIKNSIPKKPRSSDEHSELCNLSTHLAHLAPLCKPAAFMAKHRSILSSDPMMVLKIRKYDIRQCEADSDSYSVSHRILMFGAWFNGQWTAIDGNRSGFSYFRPISMISETLFKCHATTWLSKILTLCPALQYHVDGPDFKGLKISISWPERCGVLCPVVSITSSGCYILQ